MDAAKIYFGLVTNTGYNTSTYQPSQITINFRALVLNNINLIDGDTCDFTASVDQDGATSNSSTISFQALIYNLVNIRLERPEGTIKNMQSPSRDTGNIGHRKQTRTQKKNKKQKTKQSNNTES
jgi:hypothetical protein